MAESASAQGNPTSSDVAGIVTDFNALLLKLRQGNDFIFLWAIERNGEPEDFSNAVTIMAHSLMNK